MHGAGRRRAEYDKDVYSQITSDFFPKPNRISFYLPILIRFRQTNWNSRDILFRAVTVETEKSYILKTLKSLKSLKIGWKVH